MFKVIGNFFSNLFKSPEMKSFESWIATVWTAEMANLWKQLGALALQEVTILLSVSTMSGADKKAQVISKLTDAAKTAGINVAISSLDTLVQSTYTGLQNSNAGITVNGQPAPVNNQGNVNG